MDDRKEKKVVIYTAIFGGKDELREPLFTSDKFDFVCFTNSPFTSEVWDVRDTPQLFEDPVRTARYHKVLPHVLFSEYETSIWVDGNMLVKKDPSPLLNKYINGNKIAIYDHKALKRRRLKFFWVSDLSARDCIYEEGEAIVDRAHKGRYQDDPRLVEEQMARYKKEGYPEHNGLVSSMVVMRKHHDPEVKKLMEAWWNEIKNGSRRDQLSFNYAAWKTRVPFVYLPGNSRHNEYFERELHKIGKSYRPEKGEPKRS